jgi:capsular exopolysaccharide synthesis family protein
MSLADHLSVLRRSWWLVALAALLGLAASAAVSTTSPRVYASSTQVFVSVQGTSTSTAVEVGQGSAAAQQKVRSYVDVVTSSRVLEPVVRRLDLPMSARELADAVTATVASNSVVLTLTVRDSDPVRAALVTDAVSESFHDVVVGSLEASPDGGPSLVTLEVLEPAVVSTEPVSPRTSRDLALGLALGAGLGYLGALARHLLDTRVRSRDDAEAAGGATVLGVTLHDPEAPARPLTVQHDPLGPRAEAYRSLRTSLQFADAGSDARVVVVTSALPGEGKTTTTANLAVTLAETGARVALVDADLRRPRLADAMGLEGAAGLTDVLIGRAALADVAQPWGRDGLDVVAAGQVPPNASELLGSTRMRELLHELRGTYDYVLFDAPPLLPVTDAAVLSHIADGALVVAAVGRTPRARLAEAVGHLRRIDTRVVGVVLTMQPTGRGSGYDSPYGASVPRPTPTTGGPASTPAARRARLAGGRSDRRTRGRRAASRRAFDRAAR